MAIFTVRRGKRYRATITLGLLEQFADNGLIAAKLRDAGFEEVEVSGSGGTRYAEAVWTDHDASAPLPPQITAIDEVA
jgi:hypothetical protein